MSERTLTLREKHLLITTIIVVGFSIILSICIGFVLPPNFVTNQSIENDSFLLSYCKCAVPRSTVLRTSLRCAPLINLLISNRSLSESFESASNVDHPYLASLSIPIYADDVTERKFVCTGVIITSLWILVGQDCVKNEIEWLLLQVRVGSAYWSAEGTIHKVIYYYTLHYHGLAAVKVTPSITFNSVTKPARLYMHNWITAFSAYWFKPNERRSKKYFTQKWSKSPCVGYEYFSAEIANSVRCKLSYKGSGLVTERGELVAFQVGTCDLKEGALSIFVDLQTGIYASWIRFVIAGKIEKIDFHNLVTNVTHKEATKIYSTLGDCSYHRVRKRGLENSPVVLPVSGDRRKDDSKFLSIWHTEKNPIVERLSGNN